MSQHEAQHKAPPEAEPPQPSAMALLDARVGIGLALMRAAEPKEQRLALAMAAAATLAAFPLPIGAYAVAVVPSLLALAALIRFHADGLAARREALASAGARAADVAVIEATTPLAATAAGAAAGMAVALAVGRPWALLYAPLPLAVAGVATFLLRPKVLGTFALLVGAVAGLLAGGGAVLTEASDGSALVADAQPRGTAATFAARAAARTDAWHRGLTALAVAVAVLLASQAALRLLASKADRA